MLSSMTVAARALLLVALAAPFAAEDVPASDDELRQLLEQMLEQDQRHRGAASEDWAAQTELDRRNVERLEAIVVEHGWPDESRVGERAAQAAFLVVQHAALEVQKRHFPRMAEARDRGELRPDLLAMLEDRILMREGQPQIYGSQIVRDPDSGGWMLYALAEPERVEELRAAVGLGPLAEYLERFGLAP